MSKSIPACAGLDRCIDAIKLENRDGGDQAFGLVLHRLRRGGGFFDEGGIQGEDIGLEGDALNHADDVDDARRGFMYSSPSSFSRSVKRWTGMVPTDFRDISA